MLGRFKHCRNYLSFSVRFSSGKASSLSQTDFWTRISALPASPSNSTPGDVSSGSLVRTASCPPMYSHNSVTRSPNFLLIFLINRIFFLTVSKLRSVFSGIGTTQSRKFSFLSKAFWVCLELILTLSVRADFTSKPSSFKLSPTHFSTCCPVQPTTGVLNVTDRHSPNFTGNRKPNALALGGKPALVC